MTHGGPVPADRPFVLLDDARPGGLARLYVDPVATLAADDPTGLEHVLNGLDAAARAGRHAAGWMAYEAGLALVPGLAPSPVAAPLGWFGLFDAPRLMPGDAVATLLPDPAGAWLGPLVPRLSQAAYREQVGRILELIRAGDIYQANLTLRADARFMGDPRALYAALRPAAAAGHGALLFDGRCWLLSFSPELFFSVADGIVTAEPMKGTAARVPGPADAAIAGALAIDPKQRAENLMIVDLIRNDLSRVARPGSVTVSDLFCVTTYPTVHQMTSRVTARLRDRLGPVDVIRAAFPCGSVTGAPKRRAMEVIAAAEPEPRGPYCGMIGRIGPDGAAAFNVAIRTLAIAAGDDTAVMGLGSGIVADSEADAEWDECMAKGAFAATMPDLALLETMRFEPAAGVLRLERHLTRLRDSAAALDFVFDRHAARNAIHAISFHLDAPMRLRLALARRGQITLHLSPAPPLDPADVWRVAVVPLPVHPADLRLAHKTSARDFYDDARVAAATDEVLFTDPAGFMTEGSRTSLFVPRDGRLLTPPLARGLLPGVLRDELLATGRAVEADLTPADLSDGFLCGNSLRGLVPARLAG